MTEADLPAANKLRELAGWNQTLADWRLLLSFEPQGCFVAIDQGSVVATVTTTTYGQAMAWIGMMLVHPEHRRRGIGTRLMRIAMDYLHGKGIHCIRLDATPAGRPVYEKLGFVAEWGLTRHQATAASAQNSANARESVPADWPALEKLDEAAFGIARGRIIHRLAEVSQSVLVCPAAGPILGYGMLRSGSQCAYLGPLVCKPELAASLMSALLHSSGDRSVFWDVPDENGVATELAKRFGFQPVRPLTRMRWGPTTVQSRPQAQLGIADPSVG